MNKGSLRILLASLPLIAATQAWGLSKSCENQMLASKVVPSCFPAGQLRNDAQMINRGDPERASFDLERVSLQQPKNYSARWLLIESFLASKYYSQAAQAANGAIAEGPPQPYLRLFRHQLQGVTTQGAQVERRYWGGAGLFAGWTSNVNAATSTDILNSTVYGPIPLSHNQRALSSPFMSFKGLIGGQTPLGTGGMLWGNAVTDLPVNFKATQFDFYRFLGMGGYRLDRNGWIFAVPVSAEMQLLGRDYFARNIFGAFEFGRHLTPMTTVVGFFEAGNINVKNDASQTGPKIMTGLAILHQLPNRRIYLQLSPFYSEYFTSDPDFAGFSDKRVPGIATKVSWFARDNVIPFASFIYRYFSYAGPRPTVLPEINRRDNLFEVTTGVGWRIRPNLLFVGSYYYARNDSNYAVYSFTVNTVQVGLVYMFDSKGQPETQTFNWI